ncbi:DUF3631 domain-containing protein [Sinorhizobium meliloti]|uniref:DUF3631 domain-containing protein n=1 Tax=Rhizobium meliloti TaxID=382 RepID=UPI000FD88625|nr:DUF3631 domain-containing protein [Sinorhizobium meliloti]RVI45673.1 DUF3631 domain-containing protein [Sinorhizobium meliloti]
MAKHEIDEPDEIRSDGIETRRTYLKSDAAALLDEIVAFLRRFIAYPSKDALVAHVLWCAHTHLMDCWESTPRMAFLSPEPGSGKTRCLELTQLLVPNPLEAINVSPAYLFRKIGDEDEGPPTVLYDEIDTVFGPRAKENEELRGLLNAGHRRGAVAGRCVVKGKRIETEELPAYCAVAMAGLGGLPDTILTRSVIIRMRKRAQDERIEPFRYRMHAPEGRALGNRLARWAATIAGTAESHIPEMPQGVTDRDADVWESLLAIAELAGGDWPEKARCSAVALVAASKENRGSLGVQLLADIRTVFGEETEKIATRRLLSSLCELTESPWADLKGKPLSPNKLANFLKGYGISSVNVRVGVYGEDDDGGTVVKGYRKEDFHDAWKRYLPSLSPQEDATAATREGEGR